MAVSPAHHPGESAGGACPWCWPASGGIPCQAPTPGEVRGGGVCPTPGGCSGLCLSLPAHYLGAMGWPRALLAALWALGAAGAAALRIGAFNIQSFGDSKVLDSDCASVIAQILAGYDITLVQEVRDPDLSAVSVLMEQINSVSRHQYSYVSSEPLGRDQYKEMYLFVYRKDAVSVVDTYQYPDPEDTFSREPFVVKFSAPSSAAKELVLVPLHAAPHHAVAEIDALYDVYLDIIDKWGTDDMLFLGDFNADCSYVKEQDWPSIRLRSSEVFKWLIPDSADTTVGNSDCAYDRIVVCGAHLRRSLKPQSATVHNFQEVFGLDQTQVSAELHGGGWEVSPGCSALADRSQLSSVQDQAQPQCTWQSPPCPSFWKRPLQGQLWLNGTSLGRHNRMPSPLPEVGS
ncbi:PREDICTED: deoxyribonuclease-1-like 2 isoform X2 [Myotis brandtii]|uniref:deoxyribonuclease-1-like 2 isoform X2 n=1 Tax=Myotis brandtii TaxID=109478 RepID=UPI0003BB8068|nr:PREDICTED: deoxyribonuclease-1-like 2 isoform X2 [Myotis brandtii]